MWLVNTSRISDADDGVIWRLLNWHFCSFVDKKLYIHVMFNRYVFNAGTYYFKLVIVLNQLYIYTAYVCSLLNIFVLLRTLLEGWKATDCKKTFYKSHIWPKNLYLKYVENSFFLFFFFFFAALIIHCSTRAFYSCCVSA